MKEKEDFKALYEKVSSEKEILSSEAAKWQKYEEVKRASLLEQHPEEERESLKDLPLDTLEFVTSKIMDVKPNVPQVSGRTKNTVIEKSYSEMTPNERRNSWSDIVKSFNKK